MYLFLFYRSVIVIIELCYVYFVMLLFFTFLFFFFLIFVVIFFFFFFFFSSRRRHTRWTGDWSSDVCSSDLCRIHSEASVILTADAGAVLTGACLARCAARVGRA